MVEQNIYVRSANEENEESEKHSMQSVQLVFTDVHDDDASPVEGETEGDENLKFDAEINLLDDVDDSEKITPL